MHIFFLKNLSGHASKQTSYEEVMFVLVNTICRGGVTTDAMGWLELGHESTMEAPGRDRIQGRIRGHSEVPRFRALLVEVKPLLLLVCLLLSLGWIGVYNGAVELSV